jgi:hypothetical protein
MHISLPRINGITLGVQMILLNGLTHGAVGIAAVRTQLDQETWLQNLDQEHDKWDVFDPTDMWLNEVSRSGKQTRVLQRIERH